MPIRVKRPGVAATAAATTQPTQPRVVCPSDVLAGCEITKEKRQEVFGKVAGGAGSTAHELFARQRVQQGTGIPCPKTNMRINLRTNTIHEIAHPNTQIDGFDYSEDFDGMQQVKQSSVYINFKCVVGKGGAQTRSLREVYWFMNGQLDVAAKIENVYFANILDGDESHAVMAKFQYLISRPEYAAVKDKVYVGDLKGYFSWFAKKFCDE